MSRKPFKTGARVTPSKGKVSALRWLLREGCASGAGIKRIRVACKVAPGAAPSAALLLLQRSQFAAHLSPSSLQSCYLCHD
jgi:hypothetical protein